MSNFKNGRFGRLFHGREKGVDPPKREQGNLLDVHMRY